MLWAFWQFFSQTPTPTPPVITSETGIWEIFIKALQQMVETDLRGVLTGVVITLWFVYKYSNIPKEINTLTEKIDKISRRQRAMIEALHALDRKGFNFIDPEEPSDEL